VEERIGVVTHYYSHLSFPKIISGRIGDDEVRHGAILDGRGVAAGNHTPDEEHQDGPTTMPRMVLGDEAPIFVTDPR
jgi:hypothetical protein